MKGTRSTDEKIVAALRDAEASSVVAAARKHGVSEQSLHRWRKKFAGMQVSDVRELRCCIGRAASYAAGPAMVIKLRPAERTVS